MHMAQTVSTPRSRLARQRRRSGTRIFQIEINEEDLIVELIANDYLAETKRDNRNAVNQALQRAVDFLIFGKEEK
jgi:hypothetical protein